MLLTISTNHRPATDLGYLLHKHPDRCQSFDLSFGKAHVFYPEAGADRCVACLLLDVDPVSLVRGKGNWKNGPFDQYVNDRPYVASSLMSVAISQVFGSALSGRSKERSELVGTEIPLSARIDVLPVRGGEELLQRMFEPLGYTVTATQHPLDEKFPDWGEGYYFSVELEQTTTVAKLLQHLYVLIPVFDGRKGYTALINSIYRLHDSDMLLPVVGELVSRGAYMDCETDYGELPVTVSTRLNRFDAVRQLLDAGADKGPLKWSELAETVAVGSVEELTHFLQPNGLGKQMAVLV